MQSCCFANMNNNYFPAFLVAAATLISSAPYCCSLKILTSHFSEYFPFVLLWNLERIILIVGRGNPQPSPPPSLQVACSAGVFWRAKVCLCSYCCSRHL